MNIYLLESMPDNPLFEGLSLLGNDDFLDTYPDNWRENYLTWEPKRLKTIWQAPQVVGNIRKFNDFPDINLVYPAFSQRAVDLLRDLLEPNGELLPVRHKIGTYYFYNCYHMTYCVDIKRSSHTKLKKGLITDTSNLIFIDELLNDLTVFKIRTQLVQIFCTQTFVDRVASASLEGFKFVPIWPLQPGVTFYDEMNRTNKEAKKYKPRNQNVSPVDVKSHTVVIRLYCGNKKPTKQELVALGEVLSALTDALYNPDQTPDQYFGDVEGHESVDGEIRVFLTAPDCDRLTSHLLPTLRALRWPGPFHVVKRRGIFVDGSASEEYVQVT